MGAGRKTVSVHVDTKNAQSNDLHGNRQPMWRSARMLRKVDLAGVIFGCTNETIPECLEKQLFGLPASHMSYVQNIEAGLSLFLFNYTTRKLHGIYKAASEGRMCIDPYCWSDGKEKTPFPAQVRICTQTDCLPLAESQFKEIISDNYYDGRHFFFELDHAQMEKLLALFASRLVSAAFNKVSGLQTRFKSPEKVGVKLFDQPRGKNNKMRSRADIVEGQEADDSCPASNPSDIGNDINWTLVNVDQLSDRKMNNSFANDPYLEDERGENIIRELMQGEDEIEKQEDLILQKLKDIKASRELSNRSLTNRPDGHMVVTTVEYTAPPEPFVPENGDVSQIPPTPLIAISDVDFQDARVFKKMYGELQERLTMTESEVRELSRRVFELEMTAGRQGTHDDSVRKVCHEISEKLVYLVGGSNGASILSSLESYSPSTDILMSLKPMSVARSNAAAVALSGNLFVFGGGNGSTWYDSVECYLPEKNDWIVCPSLLQKKGSLSSACAQNKLYAIGGGNGTEVFSNVEMFDSVLGRWITIQSLHERRLATAAAELNGSLYAVGGFNGESYLQSLERLDLREPHWTKLQSMKVRRASLSLSVMNEKLYALGGYDGSNMMSSVEIFDPRANSWIIGEPMNYCRGYAGSVVFLDHIYVFAGLTDIANNLVDKVEIYNVGQGWGITNLKAVGKKFSFATAVI